MSKGRDIGSGRGVKPCCARRQHKDRAPFTSCILPHTKRSLLLCMCVQATVACSANGLLGQGAMGVDTGPSQEVAEWLQSWSQGQESGHAVLQAFQLGLEAAA